MLLADSRRAANGRCRGHGGLLLPLLLLIPGGVAEAATPSAESAALPAAEGVVLAEPPRAVGDFELVSQDGRSVRFSSLRGAPLLVFFGFAHCPDVCPTTLHRLKMLKESGNGEFRDVAVVMISVDGDRDTPAVLKSYLSNIASDFIGLTGEPRKVRDIAAQFPAVFFKGLPTDATGNYRVEHTSQVYAIDREGRLRAEFSNATIAAMAAVTRALIREQAETG